LRLVAEFSQVALCTVHNNECRYPYGFVTMIIEIEAERESRRSDEVKVGISASPHWAWCGANLPDRNAGHGNGCLTIDGILFKPLTHASPSSHDLSRYRSSKAHFNNQCIITTLDQEPLYQNHHYPHTAMGSVVLPHLRTGWHVDQAILSEEDRLVVIRFGRDHDPDCMRQDEVLYKVADKVKNFAVRTFNPCYQCSIY
jgi:hypothetical protein